MAFFGILEEMWPPLKFNSSGGMFYKKIWFDAKGVRYARVKNVLLWGAWNSIKMAFFGILEEMWPPLKLNSSGGMFYKKIWFDACKP